MVRDKANRRPSTLGGAVYLLVVAMAVTGLLTTIAGAWRVGVTWMGTGLLIGAVSRLALPESRAGMLRVRRRVPDVGMLTLAGLALIVLAVIVPDQPG